MRLNILTIIVVKRLLGAWKVHKESYSSERLSIP